MYKNTPNNATQHPTLPSPSQQCYHDPHTPGVLGVSLTMLPFSGRKTSSPSILRPSRLAVLSTLKRRMMWLRMTFSSIIANF